MHAHRPPPPLRVHACVGVCMCVQVEVYDNQLEAVLEALKYQTPFAFDALTYIIISRLSMDRDKASAGIVHEVYAC